MASITTFRWSTVLALALACICVGYAESTILPEVVVIAAVVVVSLVVLLRLEKRVELLTIPAANRLGLCLGAANLIWAGGRITWELQHRELQSMPWQLMLAAMFGPLLITAMPAKLARREKHSGDYWALHAMGLFSVCLAGAMAEDFTILVLIALYAATTCWSLSLLYLLQSSGTIVQHSAENISVPSEAAPAESTRSLRIAPVLVLMLVAAVFALPLYLFTPASPAEKLSFNQKRIEIGYSADQVVNLNLTGDLKADDSIAFEVTVSAEGNPLPQLSLEQRWIGRHVREYIRGEWKSSESSSLPTVAIDCPTENWTPPRLGPGQITLTFSVPASLHAEFLADPVAWANHQPAPVASITPLGKIGWMNMRDGTFFPDSRFSKYETKRDYVQVWRAEKDPDLSPSFSVNDASFNSRMSKLCENRIARVETYARQLLNEMIEAGMLPADCFQSTTLKPKREYHDRIARFFCKHLSEDRNLTYTTTLKRSRPDIDPVEDFLFYTRAGHCELFASALALMLRSQGIPAVLVLGFKGCEATEEPGKYIVRQQMTHAWVSALILEYESNPEHEWDPRKNPFLSRWRSLDPTPTDQLGAGGNTAALSSISFFKKMQNGVHQFFFVYSPEQRHRVLTALFSDYQTEIIASFCTLLATILSFRLWLRQRSKVEITAQGKLQRLLQLLARHGLTLEPGETPLEFATRATPILRRKPAVAILADVPLEWVEAYYEMRYGEGVLVPARREQLETRLDQLMQQLNDKHR